MCVSRLRGSSSASGSRRAATGAGRDPQTCRQTVMDRDHRVCRSRAADLAFLTRSHGPQRCGLPYVESRYRSRTEEARGSNPLTSTPNLAGQSVASVERAALTACCGRATAASVSRSPARKARSDQATRPWTFHGDHGAWSPPPTRATHPLRRQTVRTRSHAGSRRWSSRSGARRDGQTRPLLAVWLPPHRRAPRSHRCRHRGRGRGTRGHRPRDTGRPHRTVDSGSWTSPARTLDVHSDTGHRTRGRDRVLGLGDLDTAGTGQTSRTTTTTRPPAGTPNVDLWTAPAALGNDDGSATMRYLPARAYL